MRVNRLHLKVKGLLLVGCAILLVLLFPLPGDAHIVNEQPWHPVPAAYLRGLFYANLKPVNWEMIAKEYNNGLTDPGYQGKSVYELLAPAKAIAGTDPTAAIRKAIADKDRQALYTASTPGVSELTRYYLAEAEKHLQQPGKAKQDILNAQQIYRAFAGVLEQVDPNAYAQMNTAWLDMTSSVGSSGILGIGGKAPDRKRFTTARKIVDGYLTANYEVADFIPGNRLLPMPAKHAIATTAVAPQLPPGTDMNDQDPLPRLVLNLEERDLEEKDLFMVAYGDMLFDSPEIFGEPAKGIGMTCSTCHNRSDINQRFFIPGVSHQPGAADVDGEFFNPHFNDHRSNDSLDIPSLRGLRFTAPYGRDGRFASLRDFTRNVIVNEFRGEEPTPFMLDSMVDYLFEFDFLPAPNLNADGTLNDKVTAAAERGEKIFNQPFKQMAGMSCATCHIPSTHFIDRQRHDIGSGKRSSPDALDSFFDTPTLLGTKYTAPYFHDGSLATLSDVVKWFNDQYRLGLNRGKQEDLTAYLEAVGTGEEPYEIFDDENTQFMLVWEELTTFISTLDTLIPEQDKYHADLLISTVSPDLRADASGLKDLSQAPLVYELADKLDEIQVAIRKDDWAKAATLWQAYKPLEAKYGENLK